MGFRHNYPKVFCDACKHDGRADTQWPTLCSACASRIRSADYKANDRVAIRAEMVASGIPLGRGDDVTAE